MLLVRNMFVKNELLTTKSKELSSDLTRGHASRPYNKLGTHFIVLINCKTTSSEAI